MTDPASQRLLDTMLCEALGQAVPPDVSSHVLAILEAEQSLESAHPELTLPQIDASPSAPRRSGAWLPLALTAALLIAVSAYFWEVHNNRLQPVSDGVFAEHGASKSNDGTVSDGNVASNSKLAENVVVDESLQPAIIAAEIERMAARNPSGGNFEIGLDDLPFGTPKFVDKPAEVSQRLVKEKIDKLSGDEIVRRLDQLLETGWSHLDIAPQPEVSVLELSARLSPIIAGRIQVADSDAKVAKGLLANDADADALLASYIRNPMNSLHLGHRWARYLIGDTAWNRLSKQQRDEAGKLFAASFRGEHSYNVIVESMLTPEGSASPGDESFAAATIWMSSLAGARSVPLTDQFCDVFLDMDVSCSRCHSHPLERNIAQQNYWNLNAIFQTGVHWQIGSKGGLQIVKDMEPDRSKDVVFYESSDARQLVASPAIVGSWIGDQPEANLSTSLRELASNLSVSERFAKATVNGLWKLVYGNRIVGRTSDPLAPPADESFVAARDLLAEQLQSHNYDLGAAITWIVASKPMRLQATLSPFDRESLVATDEQLHRSEMQQRAFAGFSNQAADWTFHELLAAVEKFNGAAMKGSLKSPSPLLAQANDSDPKAKPESKSRAQLREDSLRRSFPHGDAHNSLPAGWLASVRKQGGFEQQVRHLFYVAGYSQTNEKQLEAATRIRRHCDSDEMALNQLWWAIRLSNDSF